MLAADGDGAQRGALRTDRGQGSRAAVPPLPPRRRSRHRFAAGPGDEVDRRGDGHRPRLRHRFRQEPDRRLRVVAGRGHHIRVRRQPGQAVAGVPGQAAGRLGFPRARHRRHGGDVAPQRDSLRRGAQAFRGTATGPTRDVGGRRDQGRRGRHGDQHALRELRSAHRRLRDPFGRGGRQHPLHHDSAGRVGRRAGHRSRDPRRHRGAVVAGTAQRARRGRPSDRVRRPAGRRRNSAAARCAWASTRIPSC